MLLKRFQKKEQLVKTFKKDTRKIIMEKLTVLTLDEVSQHEDSIKKNVSASLYSSVPYF